MSPYDGKQSTRLWSNSSSLSLHTHPHGRLPARLISIQVRTPVFLMTHATPTKQICERQVFFVLRRKHVFADQIMSQVTLLRVRDWFCRGCRCRAACMRRPLMGTGGAALSCVNLQRLHWENATLGKCYVFSTKTLPELPRKPNIARMKDAGRLDTRLDHRDPTFR